MRVEPKGVELKEGDIAEIEERLRREELELDKLPFEEYCRKIFDPSKTFEKPEALKGIRWLSCTMYVFTPHSVSNLAELGAECIKIEMPRMGDPMRHTTPYNELYLYPLHDERPLSGTGLGFANCNVNEYFITMDYHQPQMIDPVFYDLVRISDGLTECYRPGTFDEWKISYRYLMKINPRFIYVWGGGFGFGPKIWGGSYDILGQAQGGLASITGFHEDMGGFPVKHSNWVIDWASGTLITVGILAALYWRRKTGLGTMIEFSQVHVSTRFTGYAIPLYHRFGVVRQRWGNWDTQLCVHGIIMCGKSDYPDAKNPQLRDEARYVMVSAFQDDDFKELCYVINRPDLWEKYKTHKERVKPEAQVEIYKALEQWASDKSRSEVVKILTDAGILAMPIMNMKEVYECEHYRVRGTIRWIEDPLFGDLLCHAGFSVGMLSETPRRVKWQWRPVGADNVRIYHDLLGYPLKTIEEWYKKGWI
jgi:crotonobetainyl-CoA:carnitine CoA-transferase CaiB-like acyl-CoA transferase